MQASDQSETDSSASDSNKTETETDTETVNDDEDEDELPVTPAEIANQMRSNGYRQTESACDRDDCAGRLWYDSHTLVCAQCSQTVDMDRQRTSVRSVDPWAEFRQTRERYQNNREKFRVVGSYPSAYDWVRSNEIDGIVSDLNAEDFYR